MSDDRQNLPSASGIARLQACPGSLRMTRGLPDRPTEDSDFGTRVHAFLARELDWDDLAPAEADIAESCQAIEETVVKQWRLRCEIPDDAHVETFRDNKRLWLERDGEKLCSGLADVIHRWGRVACIIDYKTLPGDHKDSMDNLQLRCLAVLASSELGWLASVDVCIIQPLVTHTPTICHYGTDDLIAAQKELLGILDAANKPDAPLVPGDQCKFCRANAICPAVHKEVETLSALTINAGGLTVPDEDMARLLGKCGSASKMIASIKAECFRRAEADPATWRSYGYEIREGAGRRSVENVAEVSERLNARGASWQDITAACSITIGDVEALTRKATGLKGMKLKDEAMHILDGCVSVKKSKPSLKRIGQEDEE